jgi:hypothetical protein
VLLLLLLLLHRKQSSMVTRSLTSRMQLLHNTKDKQHNNHTQLRMTNPTPTAMASSNTHTHTKQPNTKKNTHTSGDRAANVNLHVRSASESTRFSLMEQVFSTSSTMAAVGAATWCRRLTTATTREA